MPPADAPAGDRHLPQNTAQIVIRNQLETLRFEIGKRQSEIELLCVERKIPQVETRGEAARQALDVNHIPFRINLQLLGIALVRKHFITHLVTGTPDFIQGEGSCFPAVRCKARVPPREVDDQGRLEILCHIVDVDDDHPHLELQPVMLCRRSRQRDSRADLHSWRQQQQQEHQCFHVTGSAHGLACDGAHAATRNRGAITSPVSGKISLEAVPVSRPARQLKAWPLRRAMCSRVDEHRKLPPQYRIVGRDVCGDRF